MVASDTVWGGIGSSAVIRSLGRSGPKSSDCAHQCAKAAPDLQIGGIRCKILGAPNFSQAGWNRATPGEGRNEDQHYFYDGAGIGYGSRSPANEYNSRGDNWCDGK